MLLSRLLKNPFCQVAKPIVAGITPYRATQIILHVFGHSVTASGQAHTQTIDFGSSYASLLAKLAAISLIKLCRRRTFHIISKISVVSHIIASITTPHRLPVRTIFLREEIQEYFESTCIVNNIHRSCALAQECP